jgi:dTDP-4-amino-4,6-dideoxygalactose transaminase
VVAPGFKYNLTDVASAIGLQQLRKAQGFLARRTELARRYAEELRDLPLAMPPEPAGGSTHAWHLFVVALTDDARLSRDDAIAKLYREGIGCSVHYIPLHLQPYWRDRYRLHPTGFPNAQRLFERCISLPLYTRMTDADQMHVVGALKSLFR